jgi:DNA polymerase I-like protein with 3'-5' exonuclease and polymerase domains
MQRELRKHLTSRWSDGHLIEIDYNALEARVLSWISKNDTPTGDVYDWISKTTGAAVPRNVIKEATLAAIYGMTRKNFALRYQDMPDAVDVYESVRSLMKVQELDGRLRTQKHFTNVFGRPLPETTAWVSYYVQSSAVDIACHGFKCLIDKLNSDVAVPVFLIHDALVLDVRSSEVENIKELCKDGLDIGIINQRFPVKVRYFNHD